MSNNYTPGEPGLPYTRTPVIQISHDVEGHTFVSVVEAVAIPLKDGSIVERSRSNSLNFTVSSSDMGETFELVDVSTNTPIPGEGTVQQLFVLLTSFTRKKQLQRDAERWPQPAPQEPEA